MNATAWICILALAVPLCTARPASAQVSEDIRVTQGATMGSATRVSRVAGSFSAQRSATLPDVLSTRRLPGLAGDAGGQSREDARTPMLPLTRGLVDAWFGAWLDQSVGPIDSKPPAPGLSEDQARPSAAVAGETAFGPSPSVSPETGSPAPGGRLRLARPVAGPEAEPGDEQPEETSGLRLPPFLLGAAAALGAHEGGHLLFSKVFGAQVGVSRVSFHGVPFFAVTHTPVSRRREFVVSSGGFWVQHALSEIILTREPDLRRRGRSFSKGVLAFDVLASTAYAGAAFSRTGPSQRDTRSMGASLGLDERWVGLMVLVPAVLDAYRYLDPDAAWAKWTSRGFKIGMVGLTLR